MKYKHLADPALPKREMTDEETRLLLTMMADEKSMAPFTEELSRDIGTAATILWRRLQHCSKARIDLGCAILIASMCKSPGEVVMWAHTIHHTAPKTRPMSASDLCFQFADGFPSDQATSMMWDAQKIGGANFLDTEEAWA